MLAHVVDQGRKRDFVGFNRAKHAVIEAAILATRVDLLGADRVVADLDRLATIVAKTAGQQERRAFALVQSHVQRKLNLTLSQ